MPNKKGRNDNMGEVEVLTAVLHYQFDLLLVLLSPCCWDVKNVSAAYHLKKSTYTSYPKLDFTSAVQEPFGLKVQTSQENVFHINTIICNVTHSVTLHKCSDGMGHDECSVTEWVTMNAV